MLTCVLSNKPSFLLQLTRSCRFARVSLVGLADGDLAVAGRAFAFAVVPFCEKRPRFHPPRVAPLDNHDRDRQDEEERHGHNGNDEHGGIHPLRRHGPRLRHRRVPRLAPAPRPAGGTRAGVEAAVVVAPLPRPDAGAAVQALHAAGARALLEGDLALRAPEPVGVAVASMAAALLVAFVRCCVRALRASALRSRLRGLPACPPARSADIDCVAPLFFDGGVVRHACYIHVCWIM